MDNKTYRKSIFGYELKGTEKQLNEMYELLNYEDYDNKKFAKYFHVWVHEGTGVHWFPKEKYYGGYVAYGIALLEYATPSNFSNRIYESDYAFYDRSNYEKVEELI